ncbi:MAG: alanine racemase [Magnetovibrio sp.]|nr:alanine racemase [Magnetovibrio sp.]
MTTNTPEALRAGALLTIDLDALQANWRTCAALAPNSTTAAVVKAGAYGLDMVRAAKALQNAGCTTFCVAAIDEGVKLREALGSGPAIHIFNGFVAGTERDFSENALTPVLNSLADIKAWSEYYTTMGEALACDLHIDTGMARLGLPDDELQTLIDTPALLGHLKIDLILSHLVAAEDVADPVNSAQLTAFKRALDHLPRARASLANSSGIHLGSEFHFDVNRAGAALYGVNPTPDKPNPMAQVVRLQGKILQVRTIDTPQTVGYGATYCAQEPQRIATVSLGYADGYHRTLSNSGMAYIGQYKAPVVGRVSMDLITLDVSGVPEELSRPGMLADLIGPNNPVDDVAERAGTIGYEILTSLGARYHRIYVGGE